MQPVSDAVTRTSTEPVASVSVGWFVRRTLIGIVILVIAVGGLAWLTHASIDQDLELRATSAPVAETSTSAVQLVSAP